MRRKERGSAIIWAMAVIMLLVVLVTAALSIALAYFSASLHENQQKQAYLTARSAVNILTEQVNDEVNKKDLIPTKYGETGKIKIPSVKMSDQMGTCSAELTRTKETVNGKEEDRLIITAHAKVYEQTYSMNAVLALTNGSGGSVEPEPEPPVDKYFGNGMFFTNFAYGQNSTVYGPMDTTAGTDVFFYNNDGSTLNFSCSNLVGTKLVEGPITLRGNVLCNQGVTMSGSDEVNRILVKGNVISSNESSDYNTYFYKELAIGGYTTVEGNVYARGILKLKDGAVIKGNVIAGQIQMENPGGVTIEGTVKTLSGKVLTGAALNKETSSLALKNGTKEVGTQADTPHILPTVTLPSYPSSSQVKNAERLTKTSFSKGLVGGKTYIAEGNIDYYTGTSKQDLKVSGEGNVYVYIPKNTKLHFRTIADAASSDPRVYFILEDENSSELHINSTGYSTETGTEDLICRAHIVGTGKIAFGAGTDFSGSVMVTPGDAFSTNNLQFSYVEPSDKTFRPTIESNDATMDGIFGGSTDAEEDAALFKAGVYTTEFNQTLNQCTVNSDFYYAGGSTFEVKETDISGNLLSTQKTVIERSTVGESLIIGGALTVNGSLTVGGDIIANEIDFLSFSPTVAGDIWTTSGTVKYNGKTVTEYQGKAIHKLTEPAASKLPAYTPPQVERPAASTIKTLTKAMIQNSSKSPIGNADNTDSYYQITGAVSSSDLYVQGTGNIYIFVDSSYETVSLRLVAQKGTQADTHVYLVMGDHASLNLGAGTREAHAHVLGTGVRVKLNGDLYGSLTVSGELQITGNITINYEPSDRINPPEKDPEPAPDPVLPEDIWKVLYYEKVE